MSTLDDPGFGNQPKVSPWPTGLRWGLIIAGVSIAVELLSYLTGSFNPADRWSGTMLMWTLVSFAASFYMYFRMQTEHRDRELGGFIRLGRCVGLGAIAGLVSGVATGIYSAIFYGLVEPNLMRESMLQKLQSDGMSEEQIEMAMKFSGWFTTPTAMMVMAPIGGLIIGCIIGLVVGFFTKRDRF